MKIADRYGDIIPMDSVNLLKEFNENLEFSGYVISYKNRVYEIERYIVVDYGDILFESTNEIDPIDLYCNYEYEFVKPLTSIEFDELLISETKLTSTEKLNWIDANLYSFLNTYPHKINTNPSQIAEEQIKLENYGIVTMQDIIEKQK